jgi:DNA-binding NarL/FixJ family response regulator
MATTVILADNLAIFRSGVLRVLSGQPGVRVAKQCAELRELIDAVQQWPASVVVFASSITSNAGGLAALLDAIDAAGSRSLMVQERDAELDPELSERLGGAVPRSVTAAHLLEALRLVAEGKRFFLGTNMEPTTAPPGRRAALIDGLTQMEISIIAHISVGCKNKEIARRLETGEQVVKNVLRGIYKKTGASDRLELALFTRQNSELMKAIQGRLTRPD